MAARVLFDFTLYPREWKDYSLPCVILEHENYWSDAAFMLDFWKLMMGFAPLRVMFGYAGSRAQLDERSEHIRVRAEDNSWVYPEGVEDLVLGRKYVIDYVLRRIEASLDTEEKTTHGTSVVHIEHILPQTLSDEWRAVLGERVAEHAAYVDRWGNLTLLGGRKNIKASNGAFAKKRKIYEDSAIKLTNRLAMLDAWSLDGIDARQIELARLADAVWAVPPA